MLLSTSSDSHPYLRAHTNTHTHERTKVPNVLFLQLLRNALIGLAASLVSDVLTNWIRVVKTVKQTSSSAAKPSDSYADIVRSLLANGSLKVCLCRWRRWW
jgi:hypothetical protein